MTHLEPICFIETPFKQKFGIPRQSLLINEAWGRMTFPKNDFFSEAFRGIEESSHLWLIFEFHQIANQNIKALVRPPRFLNKKKMGVFATRSPHRPNRIGLSVVKFEAIEYLPKEIILSVSGVDICHGTPVFDIKPYVPYCDSVKAISPFETLPPLMKVRWICEKVPESDLIEKVIALDPRPGQERESEKDYAVSVAGWNVIFKFSINQFEIISAIRLN